jgi:hypothetical protein
MAGSLFVTAHLNARLGATDRFTFFEDPLDAALDAAGLGEVTGGGSLIVAEKVAHVDIDIALEALSDAALDLIVETLERCGAPKGSWLQDGDGARLREFGRSEVLALPLDGVSLPDEVYHGFDLDAFLAEALARLGGTGGYQGQECGPRFTTLFFAGPDYAAMASALQPLVATRPVCANTVLERVA